MHTHSVLSNDSEMASYTFVPNSVLIIFVDGFI